MSTNFPGTRDTFARPAPGDPRIGHAQLHDDLSDAVEAIQEAIGTQDVIDPTSVNSRLTALEAVDSSIYGWQTFTPDGIGWNYELYPIAPSITRVDGRRRLGSAGITPEALFDLFSTARTAPVTTYYVSVATGSDSNDGLTNITQFRSLNKAVLAGNATGGPYKVFVENGFYYRGLSFTSTTSTNITQDAAFVAVGGTVVCASCDQFATPALDATYTNCYAITIATVEKVLDLLTKNPDGSYEEMIYATSPAACNTRPGTWTASGGKVYVNRADGLAVVNTNTRVLRQHACFRLSSANVSVYLGSDDGLGGWAFQGSDASGAIRVDMTNPGGSPTRALVVKNCAFSHAGGVLTTGRSVQVNSYPGIVAFFDCSATKSRTDLYNSKNTYGASPAPALLTVNCVGTSAGAYNGTSCNALTLHDNVIGMDIAGYYEGGAGGTVHNINTSKAALVGTYAGMDRGDKAHGGDIEPTAIRAANTATIDCYAVSVWQPAGMAYHADDTSVVRLFGDCTWPARYAGNVAVMPGT